jgi:nucleoid-associated protein YgaU
VVGVGIAAIPVAAVAGSPGPSPARSAALSPPNWPSDGVLPAPRWPAGGPRTPAQPPAQPAPRPLLGSAAPCSHRVLVHPRDTLWDIAARALPGRPTPARVAASWPRWWAANRAVIGPDPDLIRPGEVLTAPPGTAKELPR